MLEKLLNKVNENYALKALRKVEDGSYDTKETAQEVYNTMFLVLKDDLDGLDITPRYYQTEYITISGPETGKRGLHWRIELDVRKYIRV